LRRAIDAALSESGSASVPIDASDAGPSILSFGTDVTTLNIDQFVRVVASYDAFTADRDAISGLLGPHRSSRR
jgi:hypothetical protein